MQTTLFNYNFVDTFIHRLSGVTKLICFILLTTAVMFTYDIRVIFGIFVFSIILLKISKIKFRQIRVMLYYVAIFLLMNVILTYIFDPDYGQVLYGTKHVLVKVAGNYDITMEQLFYQSTKVLKYLAVIPLGIIFLSTTNPSEFAASLNKIGINYKVGMVLALTLRYFPDVYSDYESISWAGQARGLDMSKKEKLSKRIKNISSVLIPLLLTTLDRVNVTSNAMELRSFGKYKKRTWYIAKPLVRQDYISIIVCVIMFLVVLYLRFFIYHTMFWNPFK